MDYEAKLEELNKMIAEKEEQERALWDHLSMLKGAERHHLSLGKEEEAARYRKQIEQVEKAVHEYHKAVWGHLREPEFRSLWTQREEILVWLSGKEDEDDE